MIKYNSSITITGIPLEAQEYVVNRKSALDWVVERCGYSVDKDSQIVNDYNDFAREMGDEDYILNLILRVITVSLETVKIVKACSLSVAPLCTHKAALLRTAGGLIFLQDRPERPSARQKSLYFGQGPFWHLHHNHYSSARPYLILGLWL